MIQSSQPSSLKFTCSAFLLHLDLDFFPCLLPCRLLSGVLRRRRGPSPLTPLSDTPSSPAAAATTAAAAAAAVSFFSSADLRDLIFSFISLNRFSLFLERDGLLLLGPAAPVQPQLPQVHLGVRFAQRDAQLEAELVALLEVLMRMMRVRMVVVMLVRFEHVPRVQNLPAGLGGVQRVQRPGVQQPVRAAGVELDVVEARDLKQIECKFTK
ncbi:hypothetical protein EYF80_029218 [Liparis tanakae]|uniref:Uncharacterized protein n=1 Tax=Liparis tanakae TaxID=230148 RepID=A0A4Z2H427_9TELE|nr:hypothetical protein EYF80_029218 [Liparis tanakae]